MNVLFFHRWTGVHGGGTETHVKNLIAQFLKRGHIVYLLTREGEEVEHLKNFYPQLHVFTVAKNLGEYDHSYEDWRVYWHTGLFMLKSFLRLVYLLAIRRLPVDVVSVHFVTEAKVASVIRTLFKKPYVFILEGYTDLEAREAKKADACISISHYESSRCQEKFGFYPNVIPIGLDASRITPIDATEAIRKVERDGKLVFTLCRLEPRKDLGTLLRAVALIKDWGREDIRFKIGGTGISEKELKDLARQLGVSVRVEFLGFVPDEAVADVYRSADLYVLPTLEEGFGIVFLEAMASGCAIVSTRVGAVPEVVGEAGFLVEPGKPEVLAEAILKVVDDLPLRFRLVTTGLERLDGFSWDKLVGRYEQVYQSVS